MIRIIIILSRYTIFLGVIVYLNNSTLSQRIGASNTGGRNLCLTVLNFLVLDKVLSSAIFNGIGPNFGVGLLHECGST